MKKIITIIAIMIGVITMKAKAITIQTTQDINDIGDIIEIARNKEEIYNKKYVILDNGSIKMIICDKNQYEINGNEIIINQGMIITKTGATTTIENQVNDISIKVNDEIYSNIKIEKAKINNEIEMYKASKWKEIIMIFGLGVGITWLFVKGVLD